MKRILAIVSIFILLLFTGMPMFTSNLLCNQIEVYADTPADTPDITDNEKIRQGITVFLNSKGAYLSSNGLQMDTVMFVMQQYVDLYFTTRDFAEEFYDQNSWLIDPAAELAKNILVNYNPYQLALRPLSVRFFNAFLQWLIDTGKITSDQTNNNLYDGYIYGNELFYVIKTTDNMSSNYYGTYSGSLIELGSPVDGLTVSNLISYYNSRNTVNGAGSNFSSSYATSNPSNNYVSGDSVSLNIQYYSNVTQSVSLKYSNYLKYSNSFSIQGKCPYLINDSIPKPNLDRFVGGLVYCADGSYGIPCRFVFQNNASSTTYYGWVGFNVTNSKYSFYAFGKFYRSANDGISNGNINFNKDDFDSTPTTPPSGSDGLTYQPKQDGTGNTYNTYNDYYNDWHEGDTYIYYPSDSGGGGGDNPGGGGDDPTPGGTTPPWNGSGSDGLYSQGGTLTPDGNGGYNLNFPDVGLPDLNIDWSINGLKDKFPFSIPWDLMAFFAVMNAEPETPEIQATIPLGLWEWDIDWDLHAFDNVARILRNMELIGFCIGLILITRSIIKG